MNALTIRPGPGGSVSPRVLGAVALLRSLPAEVASMADEYALWAVASVAIEEAPVADQLSRRWVAAPTLPVEMQDRINFAVERLFGDGMLDVGEMTRPSRLAVLAVALLADPDCKPVIMAAIDQVLQSDGNFVRLRVRIGLPAFSAADVATAAHDGMVDALRRRDPKDMVTLANADYHRRKATAERGSRIASRGDVERDLCRATAALHRDASAVLDRLRLTA